MYEHQTHTPLSGRLFLRRLVLHFATASAFVVVSLLIGMWGYAHYEGLGTLDAFVNTALLLAGIGATEDPHTEGGKLFVGIYALYAGLVFVVVAGMILVPVVHRVLHKFHAKRGHGST